MLSRPPLVLISMLLTACGGDDSGGGAGVGGAEGEGESAAASELGAPCTEDGQCGADGVCVDTVPGGYCATRASGGTCGAGSVFEEFDDGDTLCLKSCTGDGDCRDHACHYCELDGATGACWAYYLPTDVATGQPCADDSVCGADGVCLTEWHGTTFPDGFCAADESEFCCPDGAEAVGFEDVEEFLCFPTCQGAADCPRAGYECGPANVCYPVDASGT